MTTALDALPIDHRLRNLPLCEIQAQYQWRGTKQPDDWYLVKRSFRVAMNTYNDLGAGWMAYRFRVKEDE
jgi:hypothetical protein